MDGLGRCRKASLACLALLLLLLPAITSAQSVTGTIDGFVTDASGAAVPGATVTAADEATKIVHATTTNASGAFTLPLLNPGVYDVIVIKAGFTTAENEHIEIQVNQKASLTFSLKVGSVGQSVDVSTQAALLDIDQVSLGTVITGEEAADLPLNGRQFIQLLQLVPGVAPITVPGQQNGSQIQIGNGAVNPAIAGATNRSNLFFINGVFATNPTYTIYAVSPPTDVVQEFQEQSHADEAEFGQATGGTVSVSTRAGTNHYHGSGYEFIRNNVFDAVPYFDKAYWLPAGATINPRFEQNQFGATIGGPFLKNKLFGFGNYEGYRHVLESTNSTALPTVAELGGDFSALLNQTTPTVIYDPATYNAATGSIQAFPGNIIPTARLNQPFIGVIKAFLPATLPATPYQQTANGQNFTNTASATVSQNQFGVRVDYAIGPHDLLYGDYFYELGTQVSPNGLPSNAFVNITGGKNTGLKYVHTFSPTLVAQLTMGWLRATSPGYSNQANAEALFDSGGFAAGFTSHPGGVPMAFVPTIENDVFGIGSGEGGDYDTVWQYSGTVTKQAGRHALKFGAALYKATLNTNYAADYEYTDQQPTANPTTGNGGEEFASLFLGLPVYSGAQVGNSGGVLFETVLGVYAQDAWKVTPKFTVNYGLRWDYSAPVTDRGNRLSGFDPYKGEWYIPKGDVDAPAVVPAGVYIAGDHIAPNDYKNFSPRLGLAYLVFPKTSVRAGAGIFFDNWAGQIQATQSARGSWPSGGVLSSGNTNTAGLSVPAVTAQSPFPGQTPFTAPTPYPGAGTFLDPKWRNAYSLQYNLQIEQQIANSQTVSFIYAGSSTSRSSIQVPFDQPLNLGPTASEVFPYPNMSASGTQVIQSVAHLSYNSLQSQYEKRFGDGLAIKGAFTWSKDIDVGCADFWEGCSIQNEYNLKGERAVSPKSLPIVMSSSIVYKLPFGKGKDHLNTGVASKLAGGWQVNGIFQHQSGTAFNLTQTTDQANAFATNGSQRYNVVGNKNGPRQRDNYFNAAAYAQPARFTFGNEGRDDLRGPMYTNLDASVFRTFTIYKDAKFEFRSEFFNVLNHTNFSTPNTGCYAFTSSGTCDLTNNVNSTFDKIRYTAGQAQARQVQFAGKITF